MKNTWLVAVLGAAVGASLMSGCGLQHVRTLERPRQTLVVLLPDSERHAVGRATVSNSSGTADLDAARQSTLVSPDEPPEPVMVLRPSEVRRIFGAALDALPPPPQRFTLFFQFDSDVLTDDSRAMAPQILHAIRERPVPDLVVVGHTDTMGTPEANFQLGRLRALRVRALLAEAGVDAAAIEISSHGESEPLARTPDETPEPRNRRVDISVR
jgi:outer membrane protein OmpA-like peptidoglycan-associated protein